MFRKARHGRHPEVALLAEGVDRNTLPVEKWPRKEVALLAEGVDRNRLWRTTPKRRSSSPSSRRAWIEISRACTSISSALVALLAEGVDRNASDFERTFTVIGRPPRGGRG